MASTELRSLRSISPLTSHYEEVHSPGHGKSGSVSVEREEEIATPVTEYPKSVDPAIPRSKTSLRDCLAITSWSLEILAWLFAAVSLVVLIIVLIHYNGKPLGAWHSKVTPNTLVNILTTIGSTALIFPLTSCIAQMRWLWMQKKERRVVDMETFGSGPIDSLMMLLKHPTWFLAYLGAANVILLLLYSPITQETIQTRLRQKELGLGTGTIARSQAYQISGPSQYTWATFNSDPSMSMGDSIDPQMEISILSAMNNVSADLSDVQAECQTANCTYEPYTSIGECSTVEDVTSNIVHECHEGECTYSVEAIDSLYPYPRVNTLVEFYVLYYPDPWVLPFDPEAPHVNASDTLVALKGTLFLCVHRYNTTVVNGTTQTIDLGQIEVNWQDASRVINKTETGVVLGTEKDGTEYWMTEAVRWQFNKYLSTETFYGVGQFIGEVDDNGNLVTQGSTDAARLFKTVLIYQKGGTDGLSKSLANLAIYMSNGLRTTGDQRDMAPGTATTPEVHISIEFRWLTAPILSIVLSLIFLLAVISSTSRAGIPPWKGSRIMPLLSLGQRARDKIGMIDEKGERVETLAREMALKLCREGDVWKLN